MRMVSVLEDVRPNFFMVGSFVQLKGLIVPPVSRDVGRRRRWERERAERMFGRHCITANNVLSVSRDSHVLSG